MKKKQAIKFHHKQHFQYTKIIRFLLYVSRHTNLLINSQIPNNKARERIKKENHNQIQIKMVEKATTRIAMICNKR